MLTPRLQLNLTREEVEYIRSKLGREPNETEWAMMEAEWSEHCSYKSSKQILKQLPTSGPRILVGPGYDSGVIDIGDGYVLTLHIESHNHPSAVDPYGGAATGVGGVVRDVLCMGTRPIAVFDSLRFGDITVSEHSRWLMSNVVRGIADYGNCIGVPTVAGEVDFDECFERNCLVDVACLGLGRKAELLLAKATEPGDPIYLIGGSTGRDGIRGASFASRTLARDMEKERSAVQVPDPFTEKLIIEAVLEANGLGLLRGCKDLGGGGLATGLSEIAEKGGTGIEVQLERIPLREPNMTPAEIMTSESQERMLLIVKKESEEALKTVMDKYDLNAAKIGSVNGTGILTVKVHGTTVASLPVSLMVNAPAIRRGTRPIRTLNRDESAPPPSRFRDVLLWLLSTPGIASKRWVYQQYDHEVGIRTVIKPGSGDATLTKLPNGKFAAVKLDGNPRYCSLDPYLGAVNVFAECCRNVVAVGAEPVAMLDHLQFGDPGDEVVFWTFTQTVRGLTDLAKTFRLPCIGGKVSFYNRDESTGRTIHPTPVIAVVGLIEADQKIATMDLKEKSEEIIAVGETKRELGGSVYHHLLRFYGVSQPPALDFEVEKRTQSAVLECIREGLVTACHDCSAGGVAVSLAEMAIKGRLGADVDFTQIQNTALRDDEFLFSESNSRFLLTTPRASDALRIFMRNRVPASKIGEVDGEPLKIKLRDGRLEYGLGELEGAYEHSLGRILEPWLS